MGENKAINLSTAVGPVALLFDQNTFPDPAERAHAWQAATSVSMETIFEPEDLDGLSGSVRVCPLGPFLLADLSLSAGIMLRRRDTRLRWEHDHIILDLIVAGGMHGRIDSHPTILGAGDCVIIDLRGGMRLRAKGLRFIAFIVPRPIFIAQAGRATAIDGRVFGADTAEGMVLGAMLRSLVAEAQRLTPSAARALAQAILNVLAECLAPHAVPQSAAGSFARAPTLAQLRRFIDQHAARPDFGPEAICASFGLSRTALYRTFAPAGGIAEAIRRRRAVIAMRLLARPGAAAARVAEVVRCSGFGTERSLRNALRDFHSTSPRDVMRDGPPLLKMETDNHVIENLFDGVYDEDYRPPHVQ